MPDAFVKHPGWYLYSLHEARLAARPERLSSAFGVRPSANVIYRSERIPTEISAHVREEGGDDAAHSRECLLDPGVERSSRWVAARRAARSQVR